MFLGADFAQDSVQNIKFLTSLKYVLGVLKYMKIIIVVLEAKQSAVLKSKWLFLKIEIHY